MPRRQSKCVSAAFWRRSSARQAAKRVHYGASGRHTGAVMTYNQCHSLPPPIYGHHRLHCVKPTSENSKILNLGPKFGPIWRLGAMTSPGCRSRLLPRYPRGMLVGPHPGGAGTTRDHARQLDTDPVWVSHRSFVDGGVETFDRIRRASASAQSVHACLCGRVERTLAVGDCIVRP